VGFLNAPLAYMHSALASCGFDVAHTQVNAFERDGAPWTRVPGSPTTTTTSGTLSDRDATSSDDDDASSGDGGNIRCSEPS
jgi:hypothetical protein